MVDAFGKKEEPKQALQFSSDEIDKFFRLDACKDDAYYVVRACYAAISYSGGLRSAEAYGLLWGDVELSSGVYTVTVKRAKQRKASPLCKFQVIAGLHTEAVKTYMDMVQEALEMEADTPFFQRGVQGSTVFINSRIGIQTMRAVGVVVATKLGLPNAMGYTGHTWRRSCAQALYDAGAGGAGNIAYGLGDPEDVPDLRGRLRHPKKQHPRPPHTSRTSATDTGSGFSSTGRDWSRTQHQRDDQGADTVGCSLPPTQTPQKINPIIIA